jgi:hypothetical protein
VAVIALFSFQPFIAFLDAHWSQILTPWRVIGYASATALLGLAAWGLVVRVRKDLSVETAALTVAAVVVSFFNFSVVFSESARGRAMLAQWVLWLTITAAAVVVAIRLGRRAGFRLAVLVFAAAFMLVPLVGVVGQLVSSGGDAQPSAQTGGSDSDLPDDLPNVYWILLDSYGRRDQHDAVLGFDNQAFEDELGDRGFEVSTSSRGSYAHTHLSVSSTLDMSYPVEPGNDVSDAFAELGPVVRGDNETVERFHALGYDYVYSPQGWLQWASCDDDYVDVCLSPRGTRLGFGETELSLLDLTPLGPLEFLGLPWTDPVYVVDQLEANEDRIDEPFFLFAHVNAPHWPYRYADGCDPRTVPLDAKALSYEARREAYVQDIECTNPLILEAVDRIVEDDPDAIVLIQSDHGSDFYANYDVAPSDWEADSLDEHFSVLNAVRFPEECADLSVEGEPLVNSFPLVFACIEDTPPELTAWRAFLSPLGDTQAIEELDPDRFGPSPSD